MARPCSICHREDADEINRDLISGESYRAIGDRIGIAHSSVWRHRNHHLAPAILDRLARHGELSADRVIAWATGIVEASMFEYGKARQANDRKAAKDFLTEARAGVELLAKLGGHLDDGPLIHVDARKQTALMSSLTEEQLRSIVRAAELKALEAGDVVEVEAVPAL